MIAQSVCDTLTGQPVDSSFHEIVVKIEKLSRSSKEISDISRTR